MGVGVIVLSNCTTGPNSLSCRLLRRLKRMIICPHASSRRGIRHTGSTSVVLLGGMRVSTRALTRLPGLGCVKVRTANFGMISVTTTGGRNVVIAGVPTCDASDITRVAFTLVLTIAGHMRRCARRGEGRQ